MKSLKTFFLAYFAPTIFGVVFLSTHGLAQEKNTVQNSPSKEFSAEDFKAHMIDHIHKGCPTNSSCSSKMGKLLNQWKNVLKLSVSKKNGWIGLERFKEKNGLPLEFWSSRVQKGEGEIVQWDSPCKNHNPETKLDKEGKALPTAFDPIMISMAFMKNINKKEKELLSQGSYFFRKAFTLNSKNKITAFNIPRNSLPQGIQKGRLLFSQQREGVYFSFTISPNGAIKLRPFLELKNPPQSSDCPKELNEEFAKQKLPKELYLGSYCQKIWNEQSRKYQPIIYGWSCN